MTETVSKTSFISLVMLLGGIAIAIISAFTWQTVQEVKANTTAINNLQQSRVETNITLKHLSDIIEEINSDRKEQNRALLNIQGVLDKIRRNSDRMNEWRQQYNRDRKEGGL